MKTIRILSLTIIALLGTAFVSAQSTDEIIEKYIAALGGKDQLGKIISVYMEGTMDAMGNQGTVKTTQLNGKGFKQEIDVMGTSVVMCYTDTMGWQIYPMGGIYTPEKMTDNQYLTGRDQIFIGGLFMMDYKAKGYALETDGQETVMNVNANKLKVVSPDNMESFYYFSVDSGYLIRIVQKGEMMGQPMEIVMTFSNYRTPENGFAMPYTMEMNYGGQFFLVYNYTKVDINKEIDPAIFAKP